jgi:hypothetical protein
VQDASSRQRLHHLGGFVLRTPLLPAHFWLTDDAADRWKQIDDLVTQPDVQEALFLGSEALFQEIHDKAPAEWSDKAKRGLAKYVARMCTRCTPFGLFATVSAGRIGPHPTAYQLSSRSSIRRFSRLDMFVLDQLCVALNADTEVRDVLRYWVNDTAWRADSQLHYVEIARESEASRQLRLSAAAIDPPLEIVLREARGRTLAELSLALQAAFADEGLEVEEAMRYLHELVDAQILRSSLWARITGLREAEDIVSQLHHSGMSGRAQHLAHTLAELADMDAQGAGISPARYGEIAGLISHTAATNRLVQVDAVRPAAATLNDEDVDAIAAALETLARIGLSEPSDPLQTFFKRFEERYGDREVPLLEVLDEDAGLGFDLGEGTGTDSQPLLKAIPLPRPKPTVAGEPSKLGLLLDLIDGAVRSGRVEARLSDADIEALSLTKTPPLAHTMAAIVAIEPHGGDFSFFVRTAGGTSAANMIGRFCGHDNAIDELVQHIADVEDRARPDAVLAEVVHFAGGREGNVIARPVLRQYEIEYLGRSGAPEHNRLPASDLMLSIRHGIPVLRSRRLDRQVIPKLTTAHNVRTGIPLYRFLRAIDAHQARTGVGWSWGPLATAPFLPRIVWKRAVFARAQWTLTHGRGFASGSGAEALRAWRRDRHVPRWVALLDGNNDNELALDLDQTDDVEILWRALKKQGIVSVVELFPRPDRLAGRSDEGHHYAEFLIPFRTGVAPQRFVPHVNTDSGRRPFGVAMFHSSWTGSSRPGNSRNGSTSDTSIPSHTCDFASVSDRTRLRRQRRSTSGSSGSWLAIESGGCSSILTTARSQDMAGQFESMSPRSSSGSIATTAFG